MMLRWCLTVLAVFRHVAGAESSDHTSKFTLGSRHNTTLIVEKRVVTEVSTCGYLNGDPNLPRTANSGYNCRVDTAHGLFGFCFTIVVTASECGFAAACIDSFSCSKGCGYTTDPSQITWTCGSGEQPPFCSTALLTFGVDQTYSYLACGTTATTDHYLATPTVAAAASVSVSAVIITRSDIPSATISTITLSTPPQSPSPSTPAATPTTPISTPPPSEVQTNGRSNNTGPIIGDVLGGLALICASVLLAIYLVRRDRTRKEMQAGKSGAGSDTNQQVMPPVELKDHRHNSGWGPESYQAACPSKDPWNCRETAIVNDNTKCNNIDVQNSRLA